MPGIQKGKKHKPGAGRPRLFAADTVRYSVSLTPEMVEHIRALGQGNLSAGVRRLYFEHPVSAPEATPELR